jgi:hypothetical protein
MLRAFLSDYFDPLSRKVRRIEKAMKRIAKERAREDVWVAHYGAFDIHPRHLVYWICMQSDSERDRLASDRALVAQLRELLVAFDYPAHARDHVHIGFESQETVDRESSGNWWHHWK